MTDPPLNPFRFGNVVIDEFADRESELAEVEADMRNGQDLVIFAPRRLGKSSLGPQGRRRGAQEKGAGRLPERDDRPEQDPLRRAARGGDLRRHRRAQSETQRQSPGDVPGPPDRSDHHRRSRRRSARLLLRRRPRRSRRGPDDRDAARTAREDRRRTRAARGPDHRRVPGDRRPRPRLSEALALRLPGSARRLSCLSRQQATRHARSLQRRERAVLAQRQADGDRPDPAGPLRPVHPRRFRRDQQRARPGGLRPAPGRSPAATRTRPRSSVIRSGSRPRSTARPTGNCWRGRWSSCCSPSTPTSHSSGTASRRASACCWKRSRGSRAGRSPAAYRDRHQLAGAELDPGRPQSSRSTASWSNGSRTASYRVMEPFLTEWLAEFVS